MIDGFLDEDFANQLVAEFPSVDEMAHSKDYMFGDKREEADFRQRRQRAEGTTTITCCRRSSPRS